MNQPQRIQRLKLFDFLFTVAIIPVFIWGGGIVPALLCWGISEIYSFRRYVEERDSA